MEVRLGTQTESVTWALVNLMPSLQRRSKCVSDLGLISTERFYITVAKVVSEYENNIRPLGEEKTV